jgi:hypothetical protein
VNEADGRTVPLRAHAAVILVVLVVGALVFANWLLGRSVHYTGTNSVQPTSLIYTATKGQTFCVHDLVVPARTDRVQMDLVPLPGKTATVSMVVRTAGGYTGRSTRLLRSGGDAVFRVPRVSKTASGTVCGTTNAYLSVAGAAQLLSNGRPQSFLDGRPVTSGRAAVWFVDSSKRTLLSLLPAAARRATVFRAGFVRPWLYLVMAIVLPLMWWLGLRRLVRERA